VSHVLAADWTGAGFMVGHAKVLWTDLVGNICALATVVLATRRLVVAWPVQILGAVLLLVASLHAHLGGNAMKQALFIALATYGWVRWVDTKVRTEVSGDQSGERASHVAHDPQ